MVYLGKKMKKLRATFSLVFGEEEVEGILEKLIGDILL
jgi:hypothetical protein